MAYTSVDGDVGDTDLSPEWFRKIEEHLSGKNTSSDTHPLNEDVKKPGHIKKHRSPSEVKIDELQAYNRNLERDNTKNVFAVSEVSRLRAEVAALTEVLVKADAEEFLLKRSTADASNATQKATREAAQARIQVESFQNSNGHFIVESSTLRRKLEEARAEARTHLSETTRCEALVKELQENLNTKQRESDELGDKNRQLIASQNASEEKAKDNEVKASFLRNKLENVEHEFQEARFSAMAAVTARDSFLTAHPWMQRADSTANASPSPSSARLEREIEKIKAEKQSLEKSSMLSRPTLPFSSHIWIWRRRAHTKHLPTKSSKNLLPLPLKMPLNMSRNRNLIPLKNPTNRTNRRIIPLSPSRSPRTYTLLIPPIRLFQRRKKPRINHTTRPPPLIIQILIILTNIPLYPSPQHPPSSPSTSTTTASQPIPSQSRPWPPNNSLPPIPLTLTNYALHAAHAPIPQPDFDAARMVAAGE
ncbi:hypothetical protein DDE83_000616 [Stemphylium lycopersici]|uniref:Uncharacterized protein n=1 Tax=Stemphylium lycopersici TaxID=183478 RepID=A0A364NG04_STELY|nr:hypothetical protein DDE83_000616 [Stemphylium lycopersici]